MARYIGPKQRLQRQIGEDLGLKTNSLKTAKKLNIRPGQHGQRMRRKISNYGVQLKEKQKVKYIYGLLEKQMRKLFKQASRDPLATGEALLVLIERRLDNVVYRLGFAPTRAAARQLVNHNHIEVNQEKMSIPSYSVKIGDTISIKSKASKIPYFADAISDESREVPEWLSRQSIVGKVLRLPERADIKEGINEQLIVEYYNK